MYLDMQIPSERRLCNHTMRAKVSRDRTMISERPAYAERVTASHVHQQNVGSGPAGGVAASSFVIRLQQAR